MDLDDDICQLRQILAQTICSYLDGLGIKLEALLLVNQEFLNILALIALELNHLAHLRVVDDGAIASELLLNDLEDFLLIKFLW